MPTIPNTGNSSASRTELSARYRNILLDWTSFANQDIHAPIPGENLACYGPGYDGWGVQTNQKACAAYAVLATEPDRAALCTHSHEQLLEAALGMLRFSLRTHCANDLTCTDGTAWGNTWISALGLERLMHGIDALEEHLTDQDLDQLRRLMLSECDWLCDVYEVRAGLVDGNRPESNLWNGAILWRTALSYPDASRVAEYRERGTQFLLNGNSIPSDAESDQLFDGKPLRDWHIGANYFESFACNHHGYLNVGYMVICLSQIALLHFWCKQRGLQAPEALYLHAKELWELVRQLQFSDGRLLRVGGDTRVRYCYCQDYLVPTWLMAEDLWGDDCSQWEAGWLAQVERELQHNGDGSFLSDRCAQLRQTSPLYFTRLESDRAMVFSSALYWRRVFPSLNQPPAPPAAITAPTTGDFAWHDEYHGAACVRGERRFASWCWRAGELPTGLCLPTEASDMAEWRYNLSSEVAGLGRNQKRELEKFEVQTFPGGFLTWGSLQYVTEGLIAESLTKLPLARLELAYAALPDDATCILLQRCTAVAYAETSLVKSINLQIPNDLWNGFSRHYSHAGGTFFQHGNEAGVKQQSLGNWLNIEDTLGVVLARGEDLQLYSPGTRQIGLRNEPFYRPDGPGGMLHVDEICAGLKQGLHTFHKNEILFDVAVVLRAGANAAETADLAAAVQVTEDGTVEVPGTDGKLYRLTWDAAASTASLSGI